MLKLPVYTLTRNPRVPLDWNLSYTFDLNSVLNCEFRIAAVPVFCTEPDNFDFDPVAVDLPWDQFDLVVLSDIEYASLEDVDAWAKKIGIQKYVLAMGHRKNKQILTQDNVLWRPWWSYNILKTNTYQDTRSKNKKFLYEALLGARRPHRDFVMLSMQASGLIDRSIVTYRDLFVGHYTILNQFDRLFPGIELLHPYVSPNLKKEWEVKDVLDNRISAMVPYSIYENTYYSIVCETLDHSEDFFMSEKMAKVFLAKRIFVLFGSQNFLGNLRQEGFKTFGSVLDESYDQIQDPLQRYAAAWTQIEWLANQDPNAICSKLDWVVEHNHQHIFQHRQQTQDRMQEILRLHIPAQYFN